ncbi:MAG TPA: cytochrome c family protein [Candidatus Paceibacterota bacterium]|nr:cytochrome c family protein [Candidatus Paceibacterota bacterium]
MDEPVQFKNRFGAAECPARFRRCFAFWFISILPAGWRIVLLATLAAFAGWSAGAQGVQHLAVVQPGGFPGLPVMNGIQRTTNGVQIFWDGPSGYYQVWQKIHLTDPTWLAVGTPYNLSRTATITTLYSNDFFRVSGPSPHYAGSQVCAGCHAGVHTTVMTTEHAGAFTSALFVAQGGQTNASCLACHTVGYGLPTGFASASKTPLLEGVQCESCHGPAANHAANPDDPTAIPQVELAAQICGGCHNAKFAPAQVAFEHPSFFEDWNASPHGAVVPDVLASMSSSTANISSCGRCHSGSARLTLLAGQNPSVTLTNDYNVAITCAVCHDPHAQHVWTNVLNGVIEFTNPLTGNGIAITNNQLGLFYTNQLRCALASTNDFVLTTSDVFTNTYDPNINVCAQCHNDRGAAWTDTSRAPHHSPQYNMMLGTVGELESGASTGFPSTHSRLEMQCAECHMQATNNSSGHAFEVATYNVCYNCHNDPAGLVQFVTNNIAGQIQLTKSYLDFWATTAAPGGLQKYGTFAWEYTTPGDLSPGGSGPGATDQALIPDDIKKARFDLYLVLYDGSFGVHNGPYDIQLLQAAQDFVIGQLYP